jgi:hypothetical protein
MKSGIRRTFAFANATLLLLLVFACPRARAAEKPRLLYATVDTQPSSTLVAANLKAKQSTVSGTDKDEFRVGVIGSTHFPSSLALAICSAEGEDREGGVAYTIVNTFDPTKGQLAKLNLRTGAATLVGSPLGHELDIMGMTCSPDGILYAIGQANSGKPDFNSLFAVDRATGFATLIGSTNVNEQASPFFSGFLMALAFAPDGTLYGVSDGATGSTLFSLDRSTGAATKVIEMNVGSVMGLAINEHGNFYVADYVQGSRVYTLQLHTGRVTPILKTHLDFVHNIALQPHDRR